MTSHLNSATLLRTALYVPASNQKALLKAHMLDVDAIIIDLEDSVAPDAKAAARDGLASILASDEAAHFRGKRIIRVNARGTSWHQDDVTAALQLTPDALLFPKIGTADDVSLMRQRVAEHASSHPTAVWSMIETPAGILNAQAIAATMEKDGVMILGLNDLAKETGMQQTPGREPMCAAITMCVLAARMHGIGILDGVYNAIADDAGFAAECRQGKAFGFDGKTIIHPRQVETANAIFGPSPEELAEAKAIVAAFSLPDNNAKGVVALRDEKGTRMVERLHLAMAQALLSKAARLADTTPGDVKG